MDPAVQYRTVVTWINGFKNRNAKEIADCYTETATHESPKVAKLHPETNGILRGKERIQQWYEDRIAHYQKLDYDLRSIEFNDASVVFTYEREATGEPTSVSKEMFELNEDGRIVVSRVL